MQIQFQHSAKETASMDTQQLRDAFLVNNLMKDDEITLIYSHYDRVIVGGTKPLKEKLFLEADKELRADYFLQRREIGIINVGGKGKITADDKTFELNKLDCLYIGKGTQKVFFESEDATSPAVFYFYHRLHTKNMKQRFIQKSRRCQQP